MEIYLNSFNFWKYNTNHNDWSTNPNNCIHIKKITPINPDNYEYTIGFSGFNDVIESAKWLKVNSAYIDYKKSSVNTENSHIIKNSSPISVEMLLEIIQNEYKGYSIHELINNYKCDFDDEGNMNYEKYMCFEIDNAGKLIVNFQDYEKTEFKSCYSFPFFRSIVENNKIPKIDYKLVKFYFLDKKIDTNNVVAFIVIFKDGKYKAYDYSHNPTPGATVTLIEILKKSNSIL